MVDRLLELKKGAADLRPDDVVVSIRLGTRKYVAISINRRSPLSNKPFTSSNSAVKLSMAVEPLCKNFLMTSNW